MSIVDRYIRVDSHKRDTATEITVEGEIDEATVPELFTPVAQALEDGTDLLILDLRRLRSIDADGIKFIGLTDWRATAAGTRLVIRPPRGYSRFVLEMCNLGHLIDRTARLGPLPSNGMGRHSRATAEVTTQSEATPASDDRA